MNNIVCLRFLEESPVYTGEKTYEEILTDGVFAIGLTKRGSSNEIIFHILAEDDGHIFETKNDTNCWHSFWLMSLIKFLETCFRYMENNNQKYKVTTGGGGFMYEQAHKKT